MHFYYIKKSFLDEDIEHTTSLDFEYEIIVQDVCEGGAPMSSQGAEGSELTAQR